jgi:hypothetical protein
MRTVHVVPTLTTLIAGLLSACADPSCLSSDDGCVIASPCEDLSFTCSDGSTELSIIEHTKDIPGGLSVSGAFGDILLENDQVTVVIEALDHPHYLGLSGGSIVDMVVKGQPHDSLRHFWQATGLLPFDYVDYQAIELLREGAIKAVQLHGTLQDRPDVHVHTRYEIRPCEPGVRVRTEIINLEPEPASWTLLDGLYLGGRESLGFAPFPGGGLKFRSFGLGELTEVMTPVPYVVSALHTEPAASYAVISCNTPETYTFLSEEIVPVGLAPALVMPRDFLIYERFLAAADGVSVSSAADIALDVRSKLFGEPYATLSGQVATDVDDGSDIGDGLRAIVTISEGTTATPLDERIPWTLAIPDESGRFSVRVPADRTYVAEVEALGRVVAEAQVKVGGPTADIGTITMPAVADVSVSATFGLLEDGDYIQVLVHPADDATAKASEGTMLGHFKTCTPMLGHPFGGSPACNLLLVTEGQAETVSLVPGTYDFFAVAGPFSTMARAENVRVDADTGQSVHLALQEIPGLLPEGVLSADFHVHGRSSFDASVPDRDRVQTMLAARLDVVAATEHDTVFDFGPIVEELGAEDRIRVMTGTETTGHVLWYWNPTVTYPQVVGHWNIWPLEYDETAPWRGAPWDELAEPGTLFTRAEDLSWPSETGIVQLNHPVGDSQFGRDFGWATATLLDGTRPLNDDATSTQGLFSRTPADARFANDAFHAQEVMNGTTNARFLAYRAFWHYLLNQGILRAGTANSDSHSLIDEIVGTPRTLVSTDQTVADFDEAAFNAEVRAGAMTGTNGPVLLVWTTDASGELRWPSLTSFAPEPGGSLHIEVRAAPWVGVEEVRVVVNGEVVQILTDVAAQPDPLMVPGDSDSLVRLDVTLALTDLLPDSGDAWISIEAGSALVDNADLDCDGFPDTGDHNGDGQITWMDVEDAEEPPEGGCFDIGSAGPLQDPTPPDDRSSPAYFFAAVTPGGYPLAFTNPLVLDLDGDGQFTGIAQ